MPFIQSLFLFLIVSITVPASATVFLPTDSAVSGLDCTVVAEKKDDKKEEEEEPDCE